MTADEVCELLDATATRPGWRYAEAADVVRGLAARVAELEALLLAQADRIAAQSELLGKAAGLDRLPPGGVDLAGIDDGDTE